LKYLLALLLLSTTAGCSANNEVSQSQLDSIADKCGLQRSSLKLVGKDELQLQPNPASQYEAVDCALTELKRAKFPNLKMGFVGHEQYQPEAK
jgi:predicted component of type VI protein secretion system